MCSYSLTQDKRNHHPSGDSDLVHEFIVQTSKPREQRSELSSHRSHRSQWLIASGRSEFGASSSRRTPRARRHWASWAQAPMRLLKPMTSKDILRILSSEDRKNMWTLWERSSRWALGPSGLHPLSHSFPCDCIVPGREQVWIITPSLHVYSSCNCFKQEVKFG